jgi:hypothetical protein
MWRWCLSLVCLFGCNSFSMSEEMRKNLAVPAASEETLAGPENPADAGPDDVQRASWTPPDYESVDDDTLRWQHANLTTYTSYPAAGSEECIKYSGCYWRGRFTAFGDHVKKSPSWVAEHNIAAVRFRSLQRARLSHAAPALGAALHRRGGLRLVRRHRLRRLLHAQLQRDRLPHRSRGAHGRALRRVRRDRRVGMHRLRSRCQPVSEARQDALRRRQAARRRASERPTPVQAEQALNERLGGTAAVSGERGPSRFTASDPSVQACQQLASRALRNSAHH